MEDAEGDEVDEHVAAGVLCGSAPIATPATDRAAAREDVDVDAVGKLLVG